MNIKKHFLSFSLIFLLMISGRIEASDLIITGIIDGPLTGGIPKAVELYAVNNIANLNVYGIGSANNGGGSDGEEFTFPSITIAAGSFIYVASENDGFNNFFGFPVRYVTNAVSINGDDAIELFKDGNVVDVFGDISVDGTGESWEYLDGWVYRKNQTGPDGSNFIEENWTFSGVDALDGETTNESASHPFPIGSYIHSSASTAPAITDIAHDPAEVTSENTVSVSAKVTDNGTVESVKLLYGTTTETYSDTINMTTSGEDIYRTVAEIPAHEHGISVYYIVKAMDNDGEITTSVEYNYMVLDYDLEPSKHVDQFIATSAGNDKIILSWHEDDGSVAPVGYLIKAATTESIAVPEDGTPVSDNPVITETSAAVNIPHGRISYEWSGLNPATTYYFKIFPYTNSNEQIDYKTNENVPATQNTTTDTSLIQTYYSETDGLTGSELKARLNDIISDHTTYPYTSTQTDIWDILKITDKDTVNPNNVILLYSGFSVDADQEFNSGNGWTREHVWAQSHGDFGTEEGPGTDAHHLRPEKSSVNSSKSNLDFDYSTTQHEEATECYYDNDSWQPREAVKGDVARMMFYMDTRYEGKNGEIDLQLVDYIPSAPNHEPYHGKLSALLEWHTDDPVDAFERKRNEIIYSFQGNRNPFIDRPEFVDVIWGNGPDAIETPIAQTIGSFKLNAAYPNPFNPSTTIGFEIPQHCRVNLTIYDLRGKLVNTLVDEAKSSGSYQVIWKGLDNNNRPVGTGVYFYQMTTDKGFSKTSKVIFLK